MRDRKQYLKEYGHNRWQNADRSQYRRGGSKAQGFAALSIEENQIIASQGGKEGHRLGRSHKFTSKEAKRAGAIGGRIGKRGKAKKK